MEYVWTDSSNSHQLDPPIVSSSRSPHPIFMSSMGTNLRLIGLIPLFTPRLSVYGVIQAFHISLTLPMSHH
eukprot:scaffold9195_cov69-Cyclotella_meneghiniana.AAC.10